MPKYSILLYGKPLEEYKPQIAAWLSAGIKVIWFGGEAEIDWLNRAYPLFARELLLLTYPVPFSGEKVIADGQGGEDFLDLLEKQCPRFNTAQYRVEHCLPEKHIVVQASAGTGKTKVMVDRILYLMHTVPDLQLSEIAMITFTNDAAAQMNRRLQDTLVRRYQLTREQKYLRWLEQQSQMNISTIHSFAYAMLKAYGIGESFTGELKIQSFQYERRELVKDLLNERIKTDEPVYSQLGAFFSEADKTVVAFWNALRQKGITGRELQQMDWGEPIDPLSRPLQTVLSSIFSQLDSHYIEIKRRENAVEIDDIIQDLQRVFISEELPLPDVHMKYLFIDEFQDSDLAQIQAACQLVRLLGAVLFVVGDVKQSIYRFRGATDEAFTLLKKTMKEMLIPAAENFALVNNYRTAAGVLKKTDAFFRTWGQIELLQYDRPVIPFHLAEGKFQLITQEQGKEEAERQILDLTNEALTSLITRVESSGKQPAEKDRVVILTRSNGQLSAVSQLLRQGKIPVSVRRDDSFYNSEAVRDFYYMLSSYLFCDEPKYIFGYLSTPYAGKTAPLDVSIMEQQYGDREDLTEYLNHFLEQTSWKEYHKQLRLRPLLSVFKDMLDKEPVIQTYIENAKGKMAREGWTEKRRNAAALSDARQYQANLEKLMEILQRNFGREQTSLYAVYQFLKLNILSNRSEAEAPVQSDDDYTSVLCMTVHKAKGLEFDTVILPYTGKRYYRETGTRMIADPFSRRIGWDFTQDNVHNLSNNYFPEMEKEEKFRNEKEECRILYVAMTRAIHSLLCIAPLSPPPDSWAGLLRLTGGDDQ